MIEAKDILLSICDALQHTYPGYTVYHDISADDFKRPSFFVEFAGKVSKPANISTIQAEVKITVNILLPMDEAGLIYQLETLEMMENVARMFLTDSLKVKDRNLSAVSVREDGISQGAGKVELTLEYMEESGRNTESREMMKEIAMRIIRKE